MNPDQPSREQIETRITALLLGELPADEATLLRYTISRDPALQQLHDQIQSALPLVREAAKQPGEAPLEKPAPLKMSDERRQKLLTHFKTPRPTEAPPKEPLFWLKRIEVSRLVTVLAVVAIVALLAAMLLPSLASAKRKAQHANTFSIARREEAEAQLQELEQTPAAQPAPPPTSSSDGKPLSLGAAPEPVAAPPPAQIVLPAPQPESGQLAYDNGNQAGGGFASGSRTTAGIRSPEEIAGHMIAPKSSIVYSQNVVGYSGGSAGTTPPPTMPPAQIVLPQVETTLEVAGQAGTPANVQAGAESKNVEGYVNLPRGGQVVMASPKTDADSSSSTSGPPKTDEFVSEVVPLRYANPDDVTRTLNALGANGGSTVSVGIGQGGSQPSGFAPNRNGSLIGGAGGIGGGGGGGFGGGSAGNQNGTTGLPLAQNQPQPEPPKTRNVPPTTTFAFDDSGVNGSKAENQTFGPAPAPGALPEGQFPATPPATEAAAESTKAEPPQRTFNSALTERGTGTVAANRFYRNRTLEAGESKVPIVSDVPVMGSLYLPATTPPSAPAANLNAETPQNIIIESDKSSPEQIAQVLNHMDQKSSGQNQTSALQQRYQTTTTHFSNGGSTAFEGPETTMGKTPDSPHMRLTKEEPLPGIAAAPAQPVAPTTDLSLADNIAPSTVTASLAPAGGNATAKVNDGTATGNPAWSGILDQPPKAHGPNNPFISNYAYVVPSTADLDQLQVTNGLVTAAEPSTFNPGVSAITPDATYDLTQKTRSIAPNLGTETMDRSAAQSEETIAPGAINFQGVDVSEALDIYGKLANRTVLRGALPAGQIFFTNQAPLTKKEAMAMLQAELAQKGISLADIGDSFVKVIPSDQASSAGAEIDKSTAGTDVPALQQEYSQQSNQIQLAGQNVEQLRRNLHVVDQDLNATAPTPTMNEQQLQMINGEMVEEAIKNQPYYSAKIDLEQKKEMHQLLYSKLEAEKLDLNLPKSSMVQITDPALPGKSQDLWQRLTGQVESKARIKVESDVTDIAGMSGPEVNAYGTYDPYFIQPTFEIMQSTRVLSNVVSALGLDTKWAKNNGGEKLTTSEAVAMLKKRLDLSQVPNTKLIEIGVEDTDPQEAADLANAVAKSYKDYRIEAREALSTNGVAFLEQQYDQQAHDIQLAQAKIDQLGAALNTQPAAPQQTAQQADLPLRKPAPNTPLPQPEILTSNNAFSTFSMNVSDVSFKFAEASLENGKLPDTASIRSEEFINAFDYRDPQAAPDQPMAFTSERALYPFAHNRELLRFSVKAAAAGRQADRPLNLVLLLDTSGSMERADRVAIVREALRVLATQLHPNDIVSVVSFARTARLWADGISGDKAGDTLDKVGGITPESGTNLEEAMRLAYETARRHYLANGMNRVVLMTDGAANLGNVDPSALKAKVEAQRKQGIALDCFGIGWEDFNDDLLEELSSNGDGRYAFLNSPEDASKDFAAKLAGALQVAAQDLKVQVEFNPQRVISYRQIGYATHQLTKEQFRDNTVAAGEIAAQEAGNALYTTEINPDGDGPIATVHVRYRIPGTQDYREHSWDVPYTGHAPVLDQSSPAMRLAATASAFSEWLAASPYAQEVTPDELLKYLSGVPEVYGADDRPKQLETMILEAKSLEGK